MTWQESVVRMNKNRHRKLERACKEYSCTIKVATKLIERRENICNNVLSCWRCPLNIAAPDYICCEIDYAVKEMNNLRRLVNTAKKASEETSL